MADLRFSAVLEGIVDGSKSEITVSIESNDHDDDLDAELVISWMVADMDGNKTIRESMVLSLDDVERSIETLKHAIDYGARRTA